MELQIKISLDNAAFGDGNSGNEVARILAKLSNRMSGRELDAGDTFLIRDVNGNRVGNATVIEEDDNGSKY